MTPIYDPNNIFAKILRGEAPSVKVYEDEVSLAFMDVMPRAEGHTLVIPKVPSRNLFDIEPQDLARFMPSVQKVAQAVRDGMKAEGISLQQFNEEAGGQQVFHLHFHVLPRWTGVPLRPPGGPFQNCRGAPPARREDHRGLRAVSHLHYVPLSGGIAALFVAILVALAILIQIGLLKRVSSALGLDPFVALIILFASLLGSYINLPLVRLPEERVVSRKVVEIMGVPFLAPVAVDWPGTILAINVGGAVIPIALSVYLLMRYRLWGPGLIAIAVVAFVVHRMATPVPGVGIAVPTFAPPLLAAVAALILSRRYAGPLAYIGGCIGVLVGADLLNLGALQSLGAPVASIGGAGTFDGVFLTGVIAVLLASLVTG